MKKNLQHVITFRQTNVIVMDFNLNANRVSLHRTGLKNTAKKDVVTDHLNISRGKT